MSEWSLPFARTAARLYGGAAALRRELRQRAPLQLRRPVVSVGNLAVGGRNKTPVVAAIARLLHGWGERPAILSRGYRRRSPSRDVVVVRDAEHMRASLDQSGDEPFMLARELPGCCVLVHPQRYVAGRYAEDQLDCTVHILDDGFQHVQLARDVDLVLVTLDDVRSGQVLPAGRLREPVSALGQADALIAVDGSAAELYLLLGRDDEHPVFEVHRHHGVPRPLCGVADFTRLPDVPVVLVTAIAGAERVAHDLRSMGWRIADHLAFADHHHFGRGDLASIEARAHDVHAEAIVCTSKDAVKLERWLPLALPTAVVPLEVAVEPIDGFATWLRTRLSLSPEGA